MTKTLSHLDHTSIDQLKEACQKDSFDFQNGKWMLILLFVNSCLNPLIYNYTNKDLKQKIHKLYKKSRNVTNEMKELNMKELSTKFRRKSLRGGSSYYNTKKCKSVLCLSTVSFNYKCNNNYGVAQGESTMNIAGLMTGERLNNHSAEAKCRMGCSVTNLALEGPVGNSNEASNSSQSQAKRTSSTLPMMKRTTVKISPDRSEKSSYGPRMKHSSSGSQSTYFQNKSIASRGSSKLAVSFPASRPSSTSPRPSPINLCRTPTEGSSSKCSSSQLVPSNSTSQDKVFPIFSSRSPNHAIPQIIGGSAFNHSKRTRSGIQVERTGSFRKGCSRRSRSSSYNHEVLSPFSIEYPNNQYRNKLMSRNTLAGMPHFSNYNSNLLSISDPISENADQETTSSSDKKEILTNSKVEANLLKQDYSVRTLEKDSYLSVPGIQTPVNSMVLLPEEDEEDDELELTKAKTFRKNISKSHSNLNKLGLSVSFSDLQTKLPRSISNNHALQSTKNHTSNSLSYRNNNNFYLHVPQLRSHAVQRRLSMDRISEESRYTSDREMPILKRSLTASQMSDDGYSPPIQIKNERKTLKDSNGPVTFKIG